MASSLLSAFGLGSAVPSASAYSDQVAETANLSNAKSQLAGVTSSLGLALTAAKMAGVDTKNLDNLNAEAMSLSNANMTSAQLQAKVTDLSSKLSTAQATQDAQRKDDTINEMQKAVDTIRARLQAVKNDTTTSAALLSQYTTLQEKANSDLTVVKAYDLSGALPTPDSLLSELDTLDAAKEKEENQTFNWTRFRKNTTKIAMFYVTIIFVTLGFLLGGIIMSNVYAADAFWGIKLFYFIYGAAFFPLSLIYGAVKAPYWVSGIMPLYPLNPTPAAQQGGAFTMPTLPPLPKLPSLPKLPAVPSISSLVSKAINPPPPPPPPAPVEAPPVATVPTDPTKVALPGPKASLFDRLFGYTLVDSNTPTTAQTSSKNFLRYIAIADLVAVTSSAMYYGIDTLITKNMIKV
jgi:hypothetical protein